MSVVYILEDDKRKNFISAQKYGRLQVVFKYGTSIGHKPEQLLNQLTDALAEFTIDDYIITTGDPALIFAAGTILSQTQDYITILKWDRQNNQYFPVTIGT